MYLQLQISYRTGEGRYETAFCNMDHEDVIRPNDYAQRWVLTYLPNGCSMLKVQMGWAPMPPDEIVMRRLERETRNNMRCL